MQWLQLMYSSLLEKYALILRWWFAAFAVVGTIAAPSCLAQARALINTSASPVSLSNVAGDEVVLGAVSLGRQRAFSMFNISAAGTITPDPEMNGAAYQLEFLICDQPDCSGEVKTDARIVANAGSATLAQLIATQSFGVSTHNAREVTMPELPPHHADGTLYLAAALKRLGNSGGAQFRSKLNLLRVDVMP